MSIASMFVLASAVLLGTFAALHIVLTYIGPKLRPRDPAVLAAMQSTHPVITRAATMWDLWIGFNVSHSLAGLLYALFYGYLAIAQPALLFGSWFLLAIGFAHLATFAWLGIRYWFATPRNGILMSLALYVAGIALR